MKLLIITGFAIILQYAAHAGVGLQGIWLSASDTLYRISLCADVPDNNNPDKVFFRGEPGHVFIILERCDSAALFKESFVWGFYPKKPISCIFFRKTKSRLVDNSNKEYDVSVTKALDKNEYQRLVENALRFSKKKYHLNHYNCYHYALALFNSLYDKPMLPVSTIRFPFLFGKGGSPCCLYSDLKKMQLTMSSRQPFTIQFVRGKAPGKDVNTGFAANVSH